MRMKIWGAPKNWTGDTCSGMGSCAAARRGSEHNSKEVDETKEYRGFQQRMGCSNCVSWSL